MEEYIEDRMGRLEAMIEHLEDRVRELEGRVEEDEPYECEHEWKEANTFYFHDHDFSLMKCVKCHETQAVQMDKKKANKSNEQNNLTK